MSWAIRTTGGAHLGFLLMRGGPEIGHCIFRSLPWDADNFDIPESEHLFALQQQGEFQWHETEAGCRITDSQGRLVASIEASRMASSDFSYEVERISESD